MSAPTEMKSTPVSAIGANVGERDPARGLERHAAADDLDRPRDLVGAHVVEQDPVGAGLERLDDLFERLGLDLDRDRRVARARLDGGTDAPRDPQVVLLDQDRVVEPGAMVRAAAAANRVLLQRRSPGVVLRVSRIVAPVPSTRSTYRDGERRDPAEAAEQVERHALAREHGAGRALETCDDRRPARPRALPGEQLDRDRRIEGREDGGRAGRPQTTPGSFTSSSARQRTAAGTIAVGRPVAVADVFGEGRGDDSGHAPRAVSSTARAPVSWSAANDDMPLEPGILGRESRGGSGRLGSHGGRARSRRRAAAGARSSG